MGRVEVCEHHDEDGDFGRIIGAAPLVSGVNEHVIVQVEESMVTTNLYILLHEDTEPGDDFDFPNVDRPITYDGRMPAPFTFRTNPGNYLVSRDQVLNMNTSAAMATVTISLVAVDVPSWLVIRTGADGEPIEKAGEIIGMTGLAAGVHRDVVVEVELEQAAGTIYAVLHVDTGTAGEFEYPDGVDVPFRFSGNIIQSPIRLLTEAGD